MELISIHCTTIAFQLDLESTQYQNERKCAHMHRHIQLLGATPLAQTVNILFANSDLSYGPSPQSFCTVQGLSQYSFIFGSSYTQPFEDARSLALLRVLASYTRNTRSSLYQSLILTAGGFTYIVHTESLSCLQTKQLPPHPVVC